MSSESSFNDLMARLDGGDPDAESEIFTLYVRRLVALACTRLDARIQRKEDPEDVVQSVYRSFFLRYADGQYDIANWESLWALLALITLRKCGSRIKYYRAARRDVSRLAQQPRDAAESRAAWEVVAQDPTPSQAAALAETVQQMMSELDDREQTILSLKLQGCTAEEIGSEVDQSVRTVGRTINRMKRKLNRILGE